jgi:serine/threonine-protein kinase
MGHGARVAEAADGVEVNTDTWARAKVLFGQAMEQPLHERRAWLERAGADADVEALVWTLVESSETLDGFLDSPVVVAQEDIEAVAAGAVVVPTEDGAAVAADARRLQPGTRLGRFDIVRELGHGGMGVVYLAHATHLGCDVALKALPPEASKDPLNRDRFTLEARAAAKINHPGVARVFDFDEIDGQLFIVSEFVDGRSLRKELAEGPLPQERAGRTGHRDRRRLARGARGRRGAP